MESSCCRLQLAIKAKWGKTMNIINRLNYSLFVLTLQPFLLLLLFVFAYFNLPYSIGSG